jgi:heme-degrading monooxygenase HmoA
MVWEIAQLEILDGHNNTFESALAEAVPLFLRAHGCRGMQVQHSVEFPQRYRLIVDWNTVEDHTVRFRESEDFARWRALVGEHFAEPPTVEHTQVLYRGDYFGHLEHGLRPEHVDVVDFGHLGPPFRAGGILPAPGTESHHARRSTARVAPAARASAAGKGLVLRAPATPGRVHASAVTACDRAHGALRAREVRSYRSL